MDRLVSLVVPPLCVACREPELGGGARVQRVRRDGAVPLRARAVPGTGRWCLPARGRRSRTRVSARRVVMALKARSATQAARFMAGAISARAPAGLLDGECWCPCPGQPAGNRRRGFDHAHEIARSWAG